VLEGCGAKFLKLESLQHKNSVTSLQCYGSVIPGANGSC